jgi:hypothetical protein
MRFGERISNPFAEGETTLWFHPLCAAYKRPEPVLEALTEASTEIDARSALEDAARKGVAHRRLPRINGAEISPTRQARCRHCREPIERGEWRVRLVFFEEGMFSPGGFVHLRCSPEYFETPDIQDRVVHFSAALNEEETGQLRQALQAGK